MNIDPDTAEQRWPAFGAAVRAGNFTSVHAIPMRLRDEVIGVMNLFLAKPGPLSQSDLELGQGLADIATIGLLQERAVQQQQVLAEQLQGALNSRVVIEQAKGMLAAHHAVAVPDAFTAMRTYARRTGRPLSNVAIDIIDGTLDHEDLRPS